MHDPILRITVECNNTSKHTKAKSYNNCETCTVVVYCSENVTKILWHLI